MADTAAEVRFGKGVALIVVAVFVFALADVLTKHLTQTMPVPLILAVRYAVNLVLLLAVFWPRHRAALFRTTRTGLVILRGVLLAAASVTMALALQVMPVAEASAIVYLAPLIVVVLARPVLGETVGATGWIGAGLGFAGVLLIVRPGTSLPLMGVTFALMNAVLSSGYHLLSRLLSRTESTMALLVITALIGTLVFGVQTALWWEPVSPGWTDIAAMLGLGLCATLGHFLFTAAYRLAPASMLAPVNYLQLAWAAGLGLLVFGQFPDRLSLIGICLVALAGVLVALRGQFGPRPAVVAPPL